MVLVIHTETNSHTKIVSEHTSLNNGLWLNLLSKAVITITFYFAAEEESVCIKCKQHGPRS